MFDDENEIEKLEISKEEENRKHRNRVILSILGVSLLIILVVGISYAVFTYSKAGTTENTIRTGSVTMSYDETSINGITITNAMPVTDTELANAKSTTATNEIFDFTVTGNIVGDTTINYEVVAVKNFEDTENKCTSEVYTAAKSITSSTDAAATAYAECDYISDNDIRLYLEHSLDSSSSYSTTAINEQTSGKTHATSNIATGTDGSAFSAISATAGTDEYGAPNSSMRIASGTFSNTGNGTQTIIKYRLRMWVNEAYITDTHSRSYSVKVNVYGKTNES